MIIASPDTLSETDQSPEEQDNFVKITTCQNGSLWWQYIEDTNGGIKILTPRTDMSEQQKDSYHRAMIERYKLMLIAIFKDNTGKESEQVHEEVLQEMERCNFEVEKNIIPLEAVA